MLSVCWLVAQYVLYLSSAQVNRDMLHCRKIAPREGGTVEAATQAEEVRRHAEDTRAASL